MTRRFLFLKLKKKHSQQTIELLNQFVTASAEALGTPPCDFAFCILGSTARLDRRPYSDVELMFLYDPHANTDKDSVDVYVFQLISCVEMMIARLGETHHVYSNDKEKQNAGFHLDSSSHLLVKELFGTPKEMAEKWVTGIIKTGEESQHPWIEDENFYSLLRSVAINENSYGSERVIKNYRDHIQHFLNALPSIEEDNIALLKQALNVKSLWFHDLKRHEMIAIGCLREIVCKSVKTLKTLKPGDKVDLKQTYYKPLCYLALNLKLYYGIEEKHPADIFQAFKKLGDKNNKNDKNIQEAMNLLIEALAFIVRQQIALHTQKNFQEEEMHYQTNDKALWAGLDLIAQCIILPLNDHLSLFLTQEKKDIAFKDLLLDAYLSNFLSNIIKNLMSSASLTTFLTATQAWHLNYLPSLFQTVHKAIEFYVQHKISQTTPIASMDFDFQKTIKTYFEGKLTQLGNAEAYINWFREVTGYLLYAQENIAVHRYYYRLLPERYRQNCLEQAKQFFSDKNAAKTYWPKEADFWEKLWEAPLSTGKRPKHAVHKNEWDKKLKSLLIQDNTVKKEDIKVTVHSLTVGEGTLKPEMVHYFIKNKWMNMKGEFTPKKDHPDAQKMAGNHLVIPYPNRDNPEFYFKIYPEYPLVELFLNALSQRLGYYMPRQVDLWLWQCGKYDYPVLVSEAVKGKTLQEKLMEKEDLNLNLPAFSQSVLTSGLTSLEDNKPDNIVVTLEKEGERLCLVDADRWFVPVFKSNQLHAKDIIFCLSLMSAPLDTLLQEELLILNPQNLLQAWVEEMQVMADKTINIFGNRIQAYYSKKRNPEEKTLLLSPLKFHAIDELFTHLQEIQDMCHESSKQNTSVTHWQLLAKINSRLANHYQSATEKNAQPLKAFDTIAGHAYIKGRGKPSDKNPSFINREYFSTRIDFKTQQEDMWAGLQDTHDIETNWRRDIQNMESQLKGLSGTHRNLIEVTNELRQGKLQKFEQLQQRLQQKILTQLNWKDLPQNFQKDLLKSIIKLGQWEEITICGSEVLNDDNAAALLAKSPQLKSLTLMDCPNLKKNFLEALPKQDAALKRMKLKNLANLTYLGNVKKGTFKNESRLNLPNLEKLEIQQCENLLEINVNAELLKDLIILKSPKLKMLNIKQEDLENLQLEECGTASIQKFEEGKQRIFSENKIDIIFWRDSSCDEIFSGILSYLDVKTFEDDFTKQIIVKKHTYILGIEDIYRYRSPLGDTNKQEEFIRMADCIAIAFSLTNKIDLDKIYQSVRHVDRVRDVDRTDEDALPIVLLGLDRNSEIVREVTYTEGQQCAKKIGAMTYIEVDFRSKTEVAAAIEKILDYLIFNKRDTYDEDNKVDHNEPNILLKQVDDIKKESKTKPDLLQRLNPRFKIGVQAKKSKEIQTFSRNEVKPRKFPKNVIKVTFLGDNRLKRTFTYAYGLSQNSIDTFEYKINVKEHNYVLHILDPDDLIHHTAMKEIYIKETHCSVIVISSIRKSTLNDAYDFAEMIKRITEMDFPPIVLLGSKVDDAIAYDKRPAVDIKSLELIEKFERVNTYTEGQQCAKKIGAMTYIEVDLRSEAEVAAAMEKILDYLIFNKKDTYDENNKVENKLITQNEAKASQHGVTPFWQKEKTKVVPKIEDITEKDEEQNEKSKDSSNQFTLQ